MPITIPQFFAATGQPLQTGLAKIIERYSKVATILPVRKIGELVHKYAKETSLGGVSTRVINQPFADVAGGSVAPAEEAIVLGGRQVQTDYRLNQMKPEARAGEIARAMRAVTRWMDDQIVNGNATVDADNLNGFAARCTGDQLIEVGENGGQLTLDLFDETVDAVIDQGAGVHAIMNKPTYRKLKGLILDQASGAAVADVTGTVPVYEGVQLHVVGDKLDGSPALDFDETQGTDDETASLYIFAPGNDEIAESGVKLLMASNSIEVVEEGTRNSMVIDVLELAFGLAVYDASAVARLKGIARPA